MERHPSLAEQLRATTHDHTYVSSPESENRYVRIAAPRINVVHVKNLLENNPSFNISNVIIYEKNDKEYEATLAFFAIRNKDEELIDYLISAGVNLNVGVPLSGTPLHLAVLMNNTELIKKLHQAGADINKKTYVGVTPLIRAVYNGHFENTKYLIDNGADVNTVIYQYSNVGYTALQIAMVRGHTQIVELLLKSNADPCFAIELSNLNVDGVRKILNSDPNINSIFICEKPRSYAPLPLVHLAVEYKNEELLDYLIDSNADLNICIPGHGTALCVAAKNNDFKLIKKLIKLGAEVNVQTDKWSLSPLILAAQNNNIEIAQYLIDNNVDVNARAVTNFDHHGCCALHVAVKRGFKDLAELLLKNNANINMETSINRSTPLINACLRENFDMMEMLVARGAVYKRNTLYAAMMNKGPKVLEYLLTLDVDAIDIYFTDIKLNDPILHHLFTDKSELGKIYSRKLRKFELGNIEIMLDAGFNINSLNYNNDLVVEIADEPRTLNFIKRHIVKSKLAGLYVCQRNTDAVKRGFNDFHTECLLEIIKLKNDKISTSNQTFYGVLHKSFRSLAIRLTHTNIDDVIDKKKLLSKYPIYGGIIYYKLAKAQRRIELLKSVEEFLHYVLNYHLKLPHTFTRKLYLYLTNENLRNLQQ